MPVTTCRIATLSGHILISIYFLTAELLAPFFVLAATSAAILVDNSQNLNCKLLYSSLECHGTMVKSRNSLIFRKNFPVAENKTIFQGTAVESTTSNFDSCPRDLRLCKLASTEAPVSEILETLRQTDALQVLAVRKHVVLNPFQRGRENDAFNPASLKHATMPPAFQIFIRSQHLQALI